MGQTESADQIAYRTDRTVLKELAKRYNGFMPFHRASRTSSCPAAPSKCRVFTTLYINADASQSALGFIDSKNVFQPTTSNMAFVRVDQQCWKLFGTDVSDGDIIIIKYKNGVYTHKIKDSGFSTELHVH